MKFFIPQRVLLLVKIASVAIPAYFYMTEAVAYDFKHVYVKQVTGIPPSPSMEPKMRELFEFTNDMASRTIAIEKSRALSASVDQNPQWLFYGLASLCCVWLIELIFAHKLTK
jgi:hypothetical protein